MKTPSAFYRPEIDGLRGIAIIAVVLFHAFPKLLRGGYVGVDIFLVISGYLISQIILRDLKHHRFSFKAFYIRRTKRLFPALITVLASCLAFGWFALWPSEYAQLGFNTAAGAGFVANIKYYADTGYFDLEAASKPLLHLWSLGVEEQFYLLWPILLLLGERWQKTVWIALTLFLLSLSGYYALLWTGHTEAAFYLPFSRFWEFMLGFAVSWREARQDVLEPGSRQPPPCWVQEALAVIGLGLILASLVLLTPESSRSSYGMAAPAVGAALMIAAPGGVWIHRWLLSRRLLVYIGLISYCLYLWHWPLIAFEHIIDNGQRDRKVLIMLIAFSFLLAHVTAFSIEKPLRHGRGSWITLGLLTGLATAGLAGGFIGHHNGLPGRFEGPIPTPLKLRDFNWEKAGWKKMDCQRAFGATEGSESFCYLRKRDEAARRALWILGDSHAGMAGLGVSEALSNRPSNTSFTLIGKGGCMPFAGIEKRTGTADCQPFFDPVFQSLLASEDPRIIVFVGRWAKRYEGTGFGVDTATSQFRLAGNPSEQDQHRIFKEGLKASLRALNAPYRQVIFMHQVPELGFQPQSCQQRPLSLVKRHDCRVARTAIEARQAPYRAAVKDVLKAFPEVIVFDPLEALCDAQFCYGQIGGEMLFFDDNHLSVEGSARIWRALDRQYPGLLDLREGPLKGDLTGPRPSEKDREP